MSPSSDNRGAVRELALLFLHLGFTAFGGPAAHLLRMKEEVVVRRRWLTEDEFLDLLGATYLIPGPNSTEMAIHIGLRRGGWPGLLVAGACFILPAALIVSAFAGAYVRFGALPLSAGLLYAVKPVLIAVMAQAIWGLARPAAKNRFLGSVGAGVLALALAGMDELALLFGAGALAGVVRWATTERAADGGIRPLALLLLAAAALAGVPSLLTWFAPAAASMAQRTPFGIGILFLFFLKVGAVLYGSGYVLLAFLRDTLVTRWHWMTAAGLLDAAAVGQVTPGPVFTTATFIGFVLGGPAGAAAATAGIFLPSFLFVALSGPLVPRLRRSALAGAFLDGVNVASLALMVAVTGQLGRAAVVDGWTLGLALVSGVLLVRFRVNSAYLILGAGAGGVLLSLGRHG